MERYSHDVINTSSWFGDHLSSKDALTCHPEVSKVRKDNLHTKVTSTSYSCVSNEGVYDTNESGSSDIASLTKQFKKFLKKRYSSKKIERENSIICHKRGKIGHIDINCANRISVANHDRDMKSTLDDESPKEKLEFSNQETRRIEGTLQSVKENWEFVKSQPSQYTVASSTSQIKEIQVQLRDQLLLNVELTRENALLQDKIKDLTDKLTNLEKLKASSDKLANLLNSGINNEKQVRYTDPPSDQYQRYENKFSTYIPTCFLCGQLGHKRPKCPLYKKSFRKVNQTNLYNSKTRLNERIYSQSESKDQKLKCSKQEKRRIKVAFQSVLTCGGIGHIDANCSYKSIAGINKSQI